jgi:hypothetical protein
MSQDEEAPKHDKPFTPRQHAIIEAIGTMAIAGDGSLHQAVEMLTTEVATLKALLLRALTPEEYDAARAEIAAATAVERALSPELQRANEELRQLFADSAAERAAEAERDRHVYQESW